MQKFHTVVIGGGASGLVSGISAKRAGNSIVILERLPVAGKKLLACGGGRCNFLNEKIDESYFNPSARELIRSAFSRFGKIGILRFFEELGLHYYSEQGRIFPVTNQASSVLKVLELELKKLDVPVELGFEVADITSSRQGFLVISSTNKRVICDKIILAAGGRSYPALGSNGSCYKFCRDFGHRVIAPVPSAVPIEISDKSCHFLQGQKIFVCAKSLINGKISSQAAGELLFTRYGLSGTAILDISQDLSIALNRQTGDRAEVLVDLVPFIEEPDLKSELALRVKKGFEPLNLLCGILPDKFGLAFGDLLKTKDPDSIAAELKHKIFKVIRTRGWNEAEFTCGGVDSSEVNFKSLESKFKKGLYFCGEILDVQGPRGGYNLAWAFSSGLIAGLTE
ncbi:MAG: NAD(P)/FAD-dependent oxidoreductase [Candidatus Omnitrophica bacterium]|nr:NAD(P)/FAD-dependent oxidoreductase [Candidatus Omnitrophota bacterium]